MQRYNKHYVALIIILMIQVYVRSSDRDRCIMSAQTQLNGLYPPHGKQVNIRLKIKAKNYNNYYNITHACKPPSFSKNKSSKSGSGLSGLVWLNIFIQDDHFSYRNCYQHGSCVHNKTDSHNIIYEKSARISLFHCKQKYPPYLSFIS